MFNKELEELRNRPIPDLEPKFPIDTHYRRWPVDTTHELFTEPCVNVLNQGIAGANHYHESKVAPYYRSIPGSVPELFLRETVAMKLQSINFRLRRSSLELFIRDAWRPAMVQYSMHHWCREQIRTRHPDWTEEQVVAEATSYWSLGPERDEDVELLSPPPHATGAVIDGGIRIVGGEHLWMGTIFDDVSARSHTRAFEEHSNEDSFSDQEALKNRRLFYWLFTEEQFRVNPKEYWHASWGDQLWAKLVATQTGMEAPAWYGAINPYARE